MQVDIPIRDSVGFDWKGRLEGTKTQLLSHE